MTENRSTNVSDRDSLFSDIFASSTMSENFCHFWMLPTKHKAEPAIVDFHEKRKNDH